MLGKRTYLYITSSFRLSRYVCFLLVVCAIVVCLADLLCSRRHATPIHTEPHPKNRNIGVQPRSDKNIGDCFGFSATLARLGKISFELDKLLRKSFQSDDNSDTIKYQTSAEGVEETSDPLKGVYRYNVVLMAYKRSGSSFVGQIFNQHPDAMYFYEPIYFLKALARRHGNIYRVMSRHLLKTIFTCSFEANPYFVSQLSDSPFRLYSRPLSEQCPKRLKNLDNIGNECKRLDVKTLIDICQSHQHVVIKSIRIEDLNEVKDIGEPNIEDPWNILKIVHLVRDPRAIISSRAHIDKVQKQWTLADFRANARALCTKMLKDLKLGTSRGYNGMYNVVRYEDIITQQEYATRDLFKFTSLSKSDKVFHWLNENSKKGHNDYAFSTAKNTTIAMNRWRKHNELSVIRVIEQECSIIMALLGYTKVRDKAQLLDISQSLFLVNAGPSIFMTRNISDTLSEIMKLKDTGML